MYGRRFLRLFYRLARKYEFSEISVDQLHERINSNDPPLVIDIRSEPEFYGPEGHIPYARHIPIRELKSSFRDLQDYKEKEIITVCPGGGMSLIAVDLLVEADFKNVKSLHGGLDLWREKKYPTSMAEEIISPEKNFKSNNLKERPKISENQHMEREYANEIHKTLDVRNFSCPIPVLKSKKSLKVLEIGQVLEILATDPGSMNDIPAWAQTTGQELLVAEEQDPSVFRFLVKRMK